jgi:hypothetical protein
MRPAWPSPSFGSSHRCRHCGNCESFLGISMIILNAKNNGF